MLTPRTRPELTLAQALVLFATSLIGILTWAGEARADGPGPGGLARVACPQGTSRCSLSVSSRHVVGHPASGRAEHRSSGSGGDLAGLAKRFAADSTICAGLGPLAPACIAAQAMNLFGGGPRPGQGPPAPPPPIMIARRAAAQLRLPHPVIGSSPSPGSEQLVGLPTWLWIERSSWTSRTATAAVPGVSVTARATPQRARWDMGDGSVENCAGPGTAWRQGRNAGAASPDCGHVFRHSSADQPRAAYSVTVTVTWSITWTGAGQAGTLPGMTTSSTVRMRVAESQGLTG